jgi:hypothetical protein
MLLLWVEGSGHDKTEILSDPTVWYGKDNLEKFKIGTYRKYGSTDFPKLLSDYFSIVKQFRKHDEASGTDQIIYCASEKKFRKVTD